MSVPEIKYDFKNSKSLKIHPKNRRQPISNMALSSPARVERRALVASEKELKHVMSVANRRMSKINQLISEKESAINDAVEAIVIENIKAGHHLVDEVFIPEYLGFLEIPPEDDGEIRIYAKDGYSLTRFDDRWLICSPDDSRTMTMLNNMYNAIIILSGLGIDVNLEDYLACKYDPERKSLEDATVEILNGIIKKREKEEMFKLDKG